MEINRVNKQQLTQGGSLIKKQADANPDKVELGSEKTAVPEGQHKKWLFMNYIAADCNLKEFQYKNIDNQERVGSDKNTHIVAMIDVGPGGGQKAEAAEGKKGEASVIDFKGAKTFYVVQDNTPDKITSPVIAEHGDYVNMSDPKTLTEFITSTMKKFPSDHVALILNDHGGGWTGALADDSDGKLMSVPQIRQALEDAEKVTGKKIDIVGFDACLMADTQAAYEFKDNARILLASEESEGGPGWTYDGMLKPQKDGVLQQNPSMSIAIDKLQNVLTKRIDVSPEEFAKLVVKVNEQHQQDIQTFSATDLTKMGDVAKSVDGLAKAILATDDKKAVKEAIMKAENYGNGWSPYGDMHDLHQVADLIEAGVSDPKLKAAAGEIKKALGEAILANEASPSSHPNSKGLHIYAKMDKEGMDENYKDLKFAKDVPSWVEAADALGKVEVPGGGGRSGGGGQEYLTTLTNALGHVPTINDIWSDGSLKKQ